MSSNPFINKEWATEHLDNARKNAGPRYIPELNIELPILEIFDGISRTSEFYHSIRKHYGQLIKALKNLSSSYDLEELQKLYKELQKEIKQLFNTLQNIGDYNTNPIPWNDIKQHAQKTKEITWKLTNELRRNKVILAKEKKKSQAERFDWDIHHLYKLQQELHYFEDLASSNKAKLSNHSFLLLTGEAGIGKTHLLCDIIEKRINSNLPAILVFGEDFSGAKDFWQRIIEMLKLPEGIDSKEKLLGTLNQAGEKSKCRSLFIIDALNETNPVSFWRIHLKEIYEEIKRYPNIALVISIRSGFEDEILTKELKEKFIQEKHIGFAFKEWEAVTKFFNAYSLPLPEVPLLMPEFQNPLFLLLLCKALKKRRSNRAYKGHEGFTYIFEYFVDNVARTIEDKYGIPHAPKKNIWDTVIEKIAEDMVNNNTNRIPEKKLKKIIKTQHPQIDTDEFIKDLDRNLLLVKVPRYGKDFSRIEGYDYRFPFQKFGDHLIVRYLLKKCKNENKELQQLFKENPKITELLKWNYGLIETLFIQYPEWYRGKEFFEIADFLKDSPQMWELWINSLIWRKPTAFSEATVEKISHFLREKVLRSVLEYNLEYNDYFFYPEFKFTYKLLDALLSVSSIPEHPLNADFLHKHLMEYKMPERDAWWSTFLHYQHEAKDTVERIIEWAWSEYDKSHISDNSVLLLAAAMSWFLTTSNRFIRDKSTKALVALLQHRVNLLPELLEKFKDVDDLYVRERLFAVAYGCVLRNSNDTESLKRLAQWIYDNIFKEGKPLVHILLRDYARGIIEVALRRGIELDSIDESKINPPYESEWPQNIPFDEEIKRYELDYESDDFKDYYWSQNTIVSSMQPEYTTLKHHMYGYFGRYVFQSALSHWDTGNITIQQLSNLAVKMIFEELGYNVELHGKFDRYFTKNYYYGTTEHKSERIGKKYQWIAFHKISAMVSDHFPLKKEPWDHIQKHYKGPWHPYIRDIDPSLLIKNDDHLINSFSINNWLSSNGNYDAWRTEKETSEWLKAKDDLPDPLKILQVKDDNGEEWLVLEGLISWQEETPPEFEKYEIPIRELWYMIKSYIIKKADLTKIYEWAKDQNFGGGWRPESREFLGEYPYSIAFEDLRSGYNIRTKEGRNEDLPVPVVVADDIYLKKFTTDCSSDGSISIKLPCKWLVNEMQLIHKFLDGRWYDDKGELVVIPTNIFADTSFSVLLIKKQNLCEFLNQNEYTILWILLGEKRVLGGNLSHRNYEGHLVINGAYVLDHNHIVGRFNGEFEK